MTNVMALEKEIANARLTISADGYPMSIGELTNLYRDAELIIRPEFQRFYRWTASQKSRLVESLLLGIPLPSVFVAQTGSGIWEVVDGLQRLSTIFELQGELKDQHNALMPPLKLEATKYLPNLEGKIWKSNNADESLTDAQRLDIKRSKIDLKIIKRESSPQTKFDLFQRLNSYGSQLNSQELRSALLVAVSPEFFAQIEQMASDPFFRDTVQLNEKQIEERYDLELVTRFIVLHDWPENKINLTNLRDLPQILDDRAVELATSFPDGFDRLRWIFTETFRVISQQAGESLFKKWDTTRKEFRGSFLTSAFEIFALGLGYRISRNEPYTSNLIEAAINLWSSPSMRSGFSTGRSTESRLVEFLPLGRNLVQGISP